MALTAVLGPILVTLALWWLSPLPVQGSTAAPAGVKPLQLMPSSRPTTKPADAPLLVAGDRRSIWVARPLMLGEDARVFTLLNRAGGASDKAKDNWLTARSEYGEYFSGTPRLLTTVPPAENAAANQPSTAYVIIGEGRLISYGLSKFVSQPAVPNGNRAMAMTAASDGVFVLGRGSLTPVTQPATGTRPSLDTQPDTQANEPQPWSLYWFHNSLWDQLPTLGRDNDVGVPAAGATVVMGHVVGSAPDPSRIIVAWVNPDAPTILHARAMVYRDPARGWSAPVTTVLRGEATRLLTTNIDGRMLVFWPVRNISDQSVDLQGGALVNLPGKESDLTLPESRLLLPLKLGEVSRNIDVSRDLGIGTTGTMIAAVTNTHEGKLFFQKFRDNGEADGSPTAIEVRGPQPNLMLFQNIAMIVLVTLLAVSLWQWRKKPPVFAVPEGMVVSQLSKRFTGFVIDLTVAIAVSAVAFSIYDPADWQRILTSWVGGFVSPDAFMSARELFYVIGIYVGHVTLCELFLGRSVGKLLTGQRVLMLDGKPPTVLAVLVRNLVRLPELFAGAGILLIYMVISEHRQRLGDLLARTIVVRPRGPDDEKPVEKNEDA